MKKLYLTFLIVVLFPLLAGADTVILKSGMQFESEKIWEEDGEIKCYRNGLVFGFPKDDVVRIDKTPPEPAEIRPRPTEQFAEHEVDERKKRDEQKDAVDSSAPDTELPEEFDFDAGKKRFESIQKELNLGYQALVKEREQLEANKKRLKSGAETLKYEERVVRYNQKAKEYERKREEFNSEVEAYKAQVDKEGHEQLFDDEAFSMMLGRWLHGPVDDFIDLWGHPDKITNMPDGSRHYLFVVEITPFLARNILFVTNPSGEIIELRTDLEKISGGSQ